MSRDKFLERSNLKMQESSIDSLKTIIYEICQSQSDGLKANTD